MVFCLGGAYRGSPIPVTGTDGALQFIGLHGFDVEPPRPYYARETAGRRQSTPISPIRPLYGRPALVTRQTEEKAERAIGDWWTGPEPM
jgi:hypothetical protein